MPRGPQGEFTPRPGDPVLFTEFDMGEGYVDPNSPEGAVNNIDALLSEMDPTWQPPAAPEKPVAPHRLRPRSRPGSSTAMRFNSEQEGE